MTTNSAIEAFWEAMTLEEARQQATQESAAQLQDNRSQICDGLRAQANEYGVAGLVAVLRASGLEVDESFDTNPKNGDMPSLTLSVEGPSPLGGIDEYEFILFQNGTASTAHTYRFVEDGQWCNMGRNPKPASTVKEGLREFSADCARVAAKQQKRKAAHPEPAV